MSQFSDAQYIFTCLLIKIPMANLRWSTKFCRKYHKQGKNL